MLRHRSVRRAARGACAIALALACAPSAVQAAAPTDLAELANGTTVSGDCSVLDNATADHLDQWVVYAVKPDRRHAAEGDQLIPYPYPKRAEDIVPTATGYAAMPQGGRLRVGDTADCQTASYDPLSARVDDPGIALDEAGLYIHQQIRQTVNWHVVNADDHTPPKACNGNDKHFPNPAGHLDPPDTDPGPNAKWVISTYCTTVTASRFTVLNDPGECPATPDKTQWPTTDYFNQYDAGAAEDLPTSSSKEGGNACGPSSTLMGALASLKRNFPGDTGPHLEALKYMIDGLPSLGETYDAVMGLSRAQITAPNTQNGAWGGKAVALLKSLGWSKAQLVMLGSSQADVATNNQNKIVNALAREPVLLSTAFGASRWGTAGGGHVILLRNLDVQHPLDYIVDDPAGNYFSTRSSSWWPNGHYGPGSCGAGVAYPMDWVHAYSAGRWMVTFGTPDGAWASMAKSARSGDAPAQTPGQSVFALQTDGAPRTLYVQDPSGRRAGIVDGQVVEEIPNSDAGVARDGDAGPGAADDVLTGATTTEHRYLVVPRPAPGSTLHVGDPAGGTFTLHTQSLDRGRVTASQDIDVPVAAGADTVADPAPLVRAASTGEPPASGAPAPAPGTPAPSADTPRPTVPGPTATPAAPRLLRAKGVRGGVRATVRCTAAAGRCDLTLVLKARSGGRSVVVGRARTSLAAGATRTLQVRLGTAGRRMLRRQGRLRATLGVVVGGRAAGRPAAVTITRA